MLAPQSMLEASQCGWPGAIAVSIWMKPLEYMKDWNWRPPSSSQIRPSTVCAARVPSVKK